MKLVIDIPDEGYDWIKNGFPDNEDKEFLIKAVKNGIPYEERPQGGINREALKRAISKQLGNYLDGTLNNRLLFGIIDNALTVTDRTEEVLSLQNTIAKLVDGIAENSRPQGEWLFDKENSFTIDMYRCSICGYFGHTHFKFCPNCGTDMRGVE